VKKTDRRTKARWV